MPRREGDLLVGWDLDPRGRIRGFHGRKAYRPFGRATQWLLPDLDRDFAKPGDALVVVRAALLSGEDVGALANLTEERRVAVSRPRTFLAGLLLGALGAGILLFIGLPPLFASAPALAALVAVGRLLGAGRVADREIARFKAWKEADRLAQMRRYMAPPPPPPSPEQREARLAAAYAGQIAEVRWEEIASIDLADGRLVASDAFDLADDVCVEVPPGDHRVLLGIARLRPEQLLWGTERIAYAAVRLSDVPPERWEAIARPDGGAMEVGVDSATIAFASAADKARFASAFDPDPIRSSSALEAVLAPVYDQGWASVEAGGGRIVAFGSGFGDGFYPLYRGLDAEGRLAAIAIDFKVY